MGKESKTVSMYVSSKVPLNLRKAASFSGEVITTLNPGTQVERKYERKEWSRVIVGGVQGFVLTKYISPIPEGEE